MMPVFFYNDSSEIIDSLIAGITTEVFNNTDIKVGKVDCH